MAKAAQFADDTFLPQKPDMAPSKAHNMNVSDELRLSSMSLYKRNMVMDEDSFETKFLKCSVCKIRFGPKCLPRLLPCHHSYCSPCVLNLFKKAKDERQNLQASLRSVTPTAALSTVSVPCPTCRTNFIATDDSISKLPADHRIVQLMDFVNHTERSTISYCSKHNKQPLNFFCEPCVRPVCRDCTFLDHKDGNGHLVMNLDEAMDKYGPVLDTAIAEMDAQATKVEGKRTALASASKTMDTVKVELLANTRSCMAKLRNLLTERERVLENKIHSEIDKEKTKLKEKSDVLGERKKTIETQSSRLKKAKREGNVEDIFRIHQEVKAYMASPTFKDKDVGDEAMTSFVLNTRDESILTSRINSFGDINIKADTTTAPQPKPTLRSYYSKNSSVP